MSDRKATEVLFVDGIENVSLINGMVRMEMFRARALRGEQAKADQENIERDEAETLVVTPQSFLGIVATLNRTVEEMEKAGIVSRTDDGASSTGTATTGNGAAKAAGKPAARAKKK